MLTHVLGVGARSIARSALLCCLVFTASDLAAQQTARLVGSVIDGRTGTPIADATITVRGTARRTLSDEQGRWLLAGLPTGELTLTIQRLGYAPKSIAAQARGDAETRLNVQLEQSGSVRDIVVARSTDRGET